MSYLTIPLNSRIISHIENNNAGTQLSMMIHDGLESNFDYVVPINSIAMRRRAVSIQFPRFLVQEGHLKKMRSSKSNNNNSNM